MARSHSPLQPPSQGQLLINCLGPCVPHAGAQRQQLVRLRFVYSTIDICHRRIVVPSTGPVARCDACLLSTTWRRRDGPTWSAGLGRRSKCCRWQGPGGKSIPAEGRSRRAVASAWPPQLAGRRRAGGLRAGHRTAAAHRSRGHGLAGRSLGLLGSTWSVFGWGRFA